MKTLFLFLIRTLFRHENFISLWFYSIFNKNKDFMLAAMKEDCLDYSVLKYVDQSLKKDKDFILSAITDENCYFWVLDYVDASLKKDKDFMLAVMKKDYLGCSALQYADKSLKKDKDFMLTAIKKDYWTLDYADESLKKDKGFILTAVQENVFTLPYADDSLKKDEEIVRAALQNSGTVFEDLDKIAKMIKMDSFDQTLDTSGMNSPLPELFTKRTFRKMETGKILKIIATDPGMYVDIPYLVRQNRHLLIKKTIESDKSIFLILRL